MSTWTKQMGFPIVRVASRQKNNQRILSLTQEKFCADGCKDDTNPQWMVPVAISTSKNPEEVAVTAMLDKTTSEVAVDGVSEEDWVKINPGKIGYYRTQYPPEMLATFEPAIRNLSIPPLDRLDLLDDLLALVKAGHSPSVQVLKLMEAFTQETNYTVWASVSNCLSNMSGLICHTDLKEEFDAYARQLFAKIASQLGWEAKPNESHLDTLLRSLVLNRMVVYGDEETVKAAKVRFDQHLSKEVSLVADLRNVCYRAVLQDADENTLEQVLKLYRTSDLHEEKVRILRSLGVIRDKALLSKVLNFSLSDEVRAQDTVFVIISVAANSHGRDLAWQFFQDNSKLFLERYQGGFLVARLVRFCTENFATEEKANEIEKFFAANPMPGTERTVQQSVETIRLTSEWLKRDLPTISNFLKGRK